MKKILRYFFKFQNIDNGLYILNNISAFYNQIKLLKVGSCKMDLLTCIFNNPDVSETDGDGVEDVGQDEEDKGVGGKDLQQVQHVNMFLHNQLP